MQLHRYVLRNNTFRVGSLGGACFLPPPPLSAYIFIKHSSVAGLLLLQLQVRSGINLDERRIHSEYFCSTASQTFSSEFANLSVFVK